jgi:hypothetical protein
MCWVKTAPVDHANAQANHVNRQEVHAKDQGDHSKLQGDHAERSWELEVRSQEPKGGAFPGYAGCQPACVCKELRDGSPRSQGAHLDCQ